VSSAEGSPIEGSSVVVDRRDRRTSSGDAPAYLEIARASVDGTAEGLAFALEMRGPLPPTLELKDGRLRLGFSLTSGSDRYLFEAEAGPTGWTARATSPSGIAEEFPGKWDVSGDALEMTVDWSYLRGMPRFRWLATAAWARERGGRNEYAFDSAPEAGPATFPE
jgi:hypothetical protein